MIILTLFILNPIEKSYTYCRCIDVQKFEAWEHRLKGQLRRKMNL